MIDAGTAGRTDALARVRRYVTQRLRRLREDLAVADSGRETVRGGAFELELVLLQLDKIEKSSPVSTCPVQEDRERGPGAR